MNEIFLRTVLYPKLTLPIVQNNCRIGQWKIGRNRPSLFDRYQILSPIKQSSMQPCRSKIVGNSFQPIGGLITGNYIHQGFRQKVTVDVIGQIGNIQFPRTLWYAQVSVQGSSVPLPVAPKKNWLWCISSFFNICLGYVDLPQPNRPDSNSLTFWMKSLFCLKSSYSNSSPLTLANRCIT